MADQPQQPDADKRCESCGALMRIAYNGGGQLVLFVCPGCGAAVNVVRPAQPVQ